MSSDKPFVIVASGPSLTKGQVDYCKDRASVVVINDNYKIAPWANYLYACDSHWWDWHREDLDLLNFKGEKYTQDNAWSENMLEHYKKMHRLKVIKSTAGKGLSLDTEVIHQGGNSGYQAINLAYHLGGRKIILIGYDQKFGSNNETHWFGDHPNGVRSNYASWVPSYNSLAEHARQIGLEIINCTIDTALTCFERKELIEVLG